MKTISITLTVLAVLVGVEGAQAQPDSLWSRTYGGESHENCYSFIQTTDGGFALAGETGSFGAGSNDFCLVMTNANGDSLWSRTYGGTEREGCFSLIQTTDGGFALAGWADSFGAGNSDFWLVRTNADGDSLWSRTFGGESYENCNSHIQMADGGFALAGRTQSFGARHDFWLVRTNADGDSLWSRTFGGGNWDECQSLIETADGGFALAGNTESFGAGGDDFWLVRTNANGDSLWSRTYGGRGDDECTSIIQTADGGFTLAGSTTSFGSGELDFWLVRTNTDGDSLWSRTFGGVRDDECNSLVQTVDGGFALAGYESSFWQGNNDFWLVRTNAGGDSLWSRAFGGENRDECNSLIQTVDGGFALAGYESSFGEGRDDFWLVKTGPDPVSVSEPIQHPLSYALDAPFPNPFNSQIQITYSLPKASLISIRVFDVEGCEVATLVTGEVQAGTNITTWNAEGFTSGIYLVRMETSTYSATRKLTLLK